MQDSKEIYLTKNLKVNGYGVYQFTYCAYYDKYLDHKATGNDMNRETAFAAIDYFLKHSQKSSHIGIAFYGGETLLCFELIKECIEYANKSSIGHNITFHIFTNGLRLAEPSVRKFLIDNQIYICVSLDGPRQLHDRYRITVTEDTTYDTIIKSLKCIQKEAPNYLEDHVSFNVVVAPPYNKSLLYDFCENIAQYTRLISLSMTEHFKKELEGKDIPEDKAIDIFSYKKMRSAVLHDLYKYHNPPNYHNNRKIYPTGTCIPGVKKIFVRNSGEILLCEKVDENNPLFCIGNVRDGIDFDKIKNVLKQYTQILSKKCSSCWASHFCPVCFREIENMETKSCDAIRNQIKREYQSYLTNVSGNEELCTFLDSFKII